MTAYKRGDVVLVPFLFSDQTTTKKRPAVIVSSNLYNDASSDIVIMAITSQIGNLCGNLWGQTPKLTFQEWGKHTP